MQRLMHPPLSCRFYSEYIKRQLNSIEIEGHGKLLQMGQINLDHIEWQSRLVGLSGLLLLLSFCSLGTVGEGSKKARML